MEPFVLIGRHVRLEPLEQRHGDALAAATAEEPQLYRWTFVPFTQEEAAKYIRTALDWRDAGTCMAFATVRANDGAVIGSTRFFNLERWAWPSHHPRSGRRFPDACEIGYTWLAPSAIRTGTNTEAKLLMLTHAFEVWQVFRACFHTDARNTRSRAALEHIGARFEGILRAHRIASDHIPRDSARYSILADEWPAVKAHLANLLRRP